MASSTATIEGVGEEVQRILDANMDEAGARRRAREAFREVQLGIDHCLFKLPLNGLKLEESYEVNSRGVEIFSKSWLPEKENCPLQGVICYCHGYGDTCTFFFEGIARKLASSGYGVFAMDYPGFGLSEGLHGYIPSFDKLVDDVIEHYSKVRENNQGLPCFLFGQSMGGAVALEVHLKQPAAWDGAILLAPLCKFAEDMLPPWLVRQILIGVAKFLPKEKLVPHRDIAERGFRDASKKELATYNVIAYKDKPRLGTALELLKITQKLEQQLEKVSLPLLILHGEADVVTDPAVSKALYEKARCSDKEIRLYEDAYHSLLEGEPDETIFKVLNDITSWLDKHCSKKL